MVFKQDLQCLFIEHQKASIGYFCNFAVVLLLNNSKQLLFFHLFYDFNEPRFLTNAIVVEDATILFKLDIMEVDFLYAPVSFHKF